MWSFPDDWTPLRTRLWIGSDAGGLPRVGFPCSVGHRYSTGGSPQQEARRREGMETAAVPVADVLPFPPRPAPVVAEKRTELTLDALKRAIAEPGEHRL